ncbi:MAG: insulinase family protein, partial [Calditrichaeota bacterium]|nr:insulinase family protein [Calditrichota bacterium]
MYRVLRLSLILLLLACQPQSQQEFKVDFEKFSLANGLEVVFHIDKSDPVTAVDLTFHVGSAREKAGRTGFAHLFEHLLFLESENLGKGGLDKMSARIGGSGANGSTSRDRTNYFQTVPNDALEKMIWAEADKLGYFINTVTDQVLAKEKQVVKNEKRQSYDNRPYGHTSYVIDRNLYPEDHPYNWQVIGSLEDLQNATLDDVKEFYRKWYVPNNATLVIAGDFDPVQAKAWVKKYFDEIPRGQEIQPLAKQPVQLSETKSLYYEDNFARLPEISMAWPSVPQYHDDSYALDVLAELLSASKTSPFYKVIVEDKKLSSRVATWNQTSELAGSFRLRIRAFEGKSLDDVQKAIDEAFTKFETDGISDTDMERIKAGQETGFYNSLSSVLGKAFQLAQYKIFANDPGFINQDIKHILAVSKADVMRVYNQYIKGKPYVVTSFVPKGEKNLALTGSNPAEVVEEKIVQGAEDEVDPNVVATYERTASSFDRTIEPPYGKAPTITIPQIWTDQLANGMKVYGIKNSEVPIVQFNIQLAGGLLLDDPAKVGVANLTAELMNAGTKNKTPQELEAAIDLLGAGINVFSGDQTFGVTANTLTKNVQAVVDLVTEMLLEPRWDETEFELAKQRIISDLNQQKADPNSIAANEFAKLIYGKDHILSRNSLGTAESVESITLDD